MHPRSTRSWRAVRALGPRYAVRSRAQCAAKHRKSRRCVRAWFRSATPKWRCRLASVTILTFMHRSNTRPAWESCSAPTTHCCRTTCGYRSHTTEEPHRCSRPVTDFDGPAGRRLLPVLRRQSCSRGKRLDFELEMAIWIGTGNLQGAAIPVTDAARHVFGLGLLNDWSARDIQAWEYQPLGPFLGKNFATTVSPWIVTLEALEPFRVPWERREEYPQPLPYLDAQPVRAAGAFDVHLEASIETAAMRDAGREPVRLSHSNFRTAFWTIDQMVAHHTVNGCNLEPGDLFGTFGTMSGPAPGEAGSLLEAHLRWDPTDRFSRRREPHVSAGRRPHRASRLVRARRSAAHRLR